LSGAGESPGAARSNASRLTDVSAFANRVRKNARHLSKWARRAGVDCYRAYDRDIPEFAFALDIYGRFAHLQEYSRRSDREDEQRAVWRAAVHEAAAQALDLPLSHVVFKRRERRSAGEQHEKTGRPGRDLVVSEQGRRFIVNLEAYLDSGLFLDHRITRALVGNESRDRRFLNLFCYTASFTVYAATGGASSSLSVDLSNTYLNWARRNFELNAIDGARHTLIRADIVHWLAQAYAGRERFDLIVLDPPAISRSKAMAHDLDVQRDHPRLIAGCERLLNRGGILYFSTNLQTFKPAADAFAGLAAEEISGQTVPDDFRNRRIHRCWRAVKRAT
jgi:23S rRNA (guanine2069-N7)-methyltransferase